MSKTCCGHCGKPLKSWGRTSAKYCSTRCRVAAHRAKHDTGDIPEALLAQPRWVNWKPVAVSGRTAKMPLDPKTGQAAKSSEPDTWGSHLQAKTRDAKQLGYMLGDGIGCIDLDHCILPDGSLTTGARQIISRYPDNWIEVSPSGDGLHIWGTAPETKGTRTLFQGQPMEFYSWRRYITITGKTFQKGTLTPLLR